MEADIRWRYQADYRDLELDQLARFVRHLPADAAVRAIGRDGPLWTLTDFLLDDVRMWQMASAGVAPRHIKPHPQRPVFVAPPDPDRIQRFREQAERIRERKRRKAREAQTGS